MQFVVRRPPEPIAAFVDALWYFEAALAHEADTVLPSGRMQLVVNLAEEVVGMPPALLSGPMTRPVLVPTSAMRRVAGVSFLPGGARPFLAMPCTELSNLDVELPFVWGRHGELVRDRLLEAVDPGALLDALTTILMERIAGDLDPDPLVARAVDALDRGQRVSEVIEGTGMSRGGFVRRFSARVGLSPKQHASVGRFQRALARLARGADDLADLALECGYYDQAHFTHEFRRYARMTPTAYRPRSPAERNHVVAV